MADIVNRNQGEVEASGKVNWRGDQVSAPHEQGIYKTSTVQLAQLGSRKVVGDRVFRYSKAVKPITRSHAVAQLGSAGTGAGSVVLATSCSAVAGSRVVTLNNPASALAENEYAEGYLLFEDGTGHTEGGHVYRIKSHPALAVSESTTMILYDEVVTAIAATDTCRLHQNMYFQVGSATAGNKVVGIAPVSCTTNDFLWLQTWGPCAIMGGTTISAGTPISLVASGQMTSFTTFGATPLGEMIGSVAAISREGVAFIQIAP